MNNQSETMNAVKEIVDNEEQLKAAIERKDEQIYRLQQICRRMALLLASAGGFAHKEKNEVILRVITALLSGEVAEVWDMDDMPF